MKLSTLYTTSNLPYVRVSDTKSSGTAGTTYNSGAYQTITLNTEEQDVGAVCSLSSNRFTLSAGKYAVRITTTTENTTAGITLRIRNTTDSSTVIKWPAYNQSIYGGYTYGLPPAQEGQFAIGVSKALELQLFTTGTWNQTARTDGENEVYWTVELVKLD